MKYVRFRLSMIAVLTVVSCFASSAIGAAARPNLVLVMVDDLGFSDLGCYGGEIRTPNLDKLAEDGLRFTQFYNNAKCETTRAALLTGLYHPEVGIGKLQNCVTLAEALRLVGYRTLMAGKWHLGSSPAKRGFDRFFGHLSGATNYFRGDDTFRLDDRPFKVPQSGFYTTDAGTDYAIDFIRESVRHDASQPFFLYIAYNAPHYPLQAPEDEVARYRGKYIRGWDELRKQRHQRQLDMGLFQRPWELSPRPADVKPWDSLTDQQRQQEDFKMATFAAMVDRVDQNIGRLMAALKELQVVENTLFLFLSDNGGCPFERTRDGHLSPWDPDSYWTYHAAWASVSNTPFRWYKQNQHEGGIATPLIVHWPGRLKKGITHQPGHLIDIMATCLDVAESQYPEMYAGRPIKPLRGKTLVPIFRGRQRDGHEALFWQFSDNRAVRAGNWKLVSARGGPWELYDLSVDRTELHDVAAEQPERAAELSARWDAWATETGAIGKSSRKKERKKRRKGA